MKRKRKAKPPKEPKIIKQPHRQPKVFLYDEFQGIVKQITNPLHRTLILVTYANGARIGEACKILWDGINWDDEFLTISQQVFKKRGTSVPIRSPPIDRIKEAWLTEPIIEFIKPFKENYLKAVMEARLAGEPEPEPPKLWSFTPRYARILIDKYLNCTPHSLRHTRATHCITIGKMNLRFVAEYFRIAPSSLGEWVVRYGHLDTEDLKEHLRGQRIK